jgi:hypothetical protein
MLQYVGFLVRFEGYCSTTSKILRISLSVNFDLLKLICGEVVTVALTKSTVGSK